MLAPAQQRIAGRSRERGEVKCRSRGPVPADWMQGDDCGLRGALHARLPHAVGCGAVAPTAMSAPSGVPRRTRITV
ncbi:hypothetical protein EYF80_018025 [Liparis tanakae]|uniref:Uncharacterized protein n=1 Tax=Liparis tanakae TaxID=230148 RepID=A0A4Z2I2Y1_9TELE|nr:hypothetical protein EYF80_018025 [Liparis tanakae]